MVGPSIPPKERGLRSFPPLQVKVCVYHGVFSVKTCLAGLAETVVDGLAGEATSW